MSGENPVCQDIEPFSGFACDRVVRSWRSCGRGCKHVTAYCSEHGGTDRAEAEMVEHHETHG